MIAWLVAVAVAGPSAEELAEDAEDAEALIERCRAVGPACGATDAELAEAFVTTAVAAAVLRGEVDARAAANARYLHPLADDGFEALLAPPDAAVPEGWLSDWREPQAEPKPWKPLVLDATDPTVVQLGLTEETLTVRRFQPHGSSWSAGEVLRATLQAQAPLSRRISGFAELGWAQGPGHNQQLVGLGVGPRLTSTGGADLHLVLVAVGDRREVDEPGKRATGWTVGPGAGAVGVHPLAHASPVALRWEAWHAQVLDFRRPRYTFGRSRVELALRWCPGRLVLTMGGRVVDDGGGSAGPTAMVGWTW